MSLTKFLNLWYNDVAYSIIHDINDITCQEKMPRRIGKKFPQFSRNYPALYPTYPAPDF